MDIPVNAVFPVAQAMLLYRRGGSRDRVLAIVSKLTKGTLTLSGVVEVGGGGAKRILAAKVGGTAPAPNHTRRIAVGTPYRSRGSEEIISCDIIIATLQVGTGFYTQVQAILEVDAIGIKGIVVGA